MNDSCLKVTLFVCRMQRKVGGKLYLKLNIGARSIGNKYREGKAESSVTRMHACARTSRCRLVVRT